jgi:hypothetical protein
MQNIKSVTDLKNAIQQLEDRQSTEWPILKEQFRTTAETLTPANIVKGAMSELLSTPELKSNVVKSVVGMLGGFIATKLFVVKIPHPLVKVAVGTIMGMASATNATKTVTVLKSIGNNLLRKILRPRDSVKKHNGEFL